MCLQAAASVRDDAVMLMVLMVLMVLMLLTAYYSVSRNIGKGVTVQ